MEKKIETKQKSLSGLYMFTTLFLMSLSSFFTVMVYNSYLAKRGIEAANMEEEKAKKVAAIDAKLSTKEAKLKDLLKSITDQLDAEIAQKRKDMEESQKDLNAVEKKRASYQTIAYDHQQYIYNSLNTSSTVDNSVPISSIKSENISTINSSLPAPTPLSPELVLGDAEKDK